MIGVAERDLGLDEMQPVERAFDVAGEDQRERHVERGA